MPISSPTVTKRHLMLCIRCDALPTTAYGPLPSEVMTSDVIDVSQSTGASPRTTIIVQFVVSAKHATQRSRFSRTPTGEHHRNTGRRPTCCSLRLYRYTSQSHEFAGNQNKNSRPVEHSNSRFESIRFYSLCESIRFVKKIGLSIH